ncbi:MAG: GH1 family beta-glucosidase [Candidatus Zhuqueibacterota bacterium]
MSFPKKFVWGAAAASYQIEGGAFEDGRGLSVWDMMCRIPGKIMNGHTGAVACDHYHRFREDAGLMGEIGLNAYRLSIAWPRVIPEGVGKVNDKGIEFYDALIDALLENGVQPWVTLFHWDYPYALYCRGGWLNADSSDWFAEYTQVIVDRLSDRVSHWMTLNEPQCFIGLGHQDGSHAPGLKLGFSEVLLAAHNALLAHGKSAQIIRARARTQPSIGAAPVGIVKAPATESKKDIEAAREGMFAISGLNCWNNTWFADPMVWGHYPADGLKLFEPYLPKIKDGDLKTIGQPLDFYGANIYHCDFYRAGAHGSPELAPFPVNQSYTLMDWPVTPDALYWGPRFLYERYKLPIVVTENGISISDWVQRDGQVHDSQRIDFLAGYLKAYKRAIAGGVDARGYFLWSIMDNFEWAYGYKQRFGIIFTDYATNTHILKDSAQWYKEVIKTNGENL